VSAPAKELRICANCQHRQHGQCTSNVFPVWVCDCLCRLIGTAPDGPKDAA
jgi:hypothetical protein